ncbi:response regulator [Candidatus Nomurabacteria bacterium]|nr:response regulator [Candidatus Nomurabacteria bacterium]
MQILCVDDEPQVGEMVKEAFEYAGHKVIVAHDPVSGLQRFIENQRSVDCLIIDCKMCKCEGECDRDGHTGLWLARQILSHQLPKILVTGESYVGLRAKAYEAGIYVIVHKPCSLDELIKITEELVDIRARG